MGLFDRDDYGRDYRDRGPGERMRGAWRHLQERMGARGAYDREMRGRGGYDARDFAYRGMDAGWSTAFNRGAHDVEWDWRRAAGRYDRNVGGRMEGGGYGREYHGGGAHGRDAWGRDAGDPYRDRQRRTAFHVLRGGFRGHGPDRGDVDYRGWNRGVGDEPAYRPEDFRGWDGGRGRDARSR